MVTGSSLGKLGNKTTGSRVNDTDPLKVARSDINHGVSAGVTGQNHGVKLGKLGK